MAKIWFVVYLLAEGLFLVHASSRDECGLSGLSSTVRALMLAKKSPLSPPHKPSSQSVRYTVAISMSRCQLALTLAVCDRVIGHVTLLPSQRPCRCCQRFAAPWVLFLLSWRSSNVLIFCNSKHSSGLSKFVTMSWFRIKASCVSQQCYFHLPWLCCPLHLWNVWNEGCFQTPGGPIQAKDGR